MAIFNEAVCNDLLSEGKILYSPMMNYIKKKKQKKEEEYNKKERLKKKHGLITKEEFNKCIDIIDHTFTNKFFKQFMYTSDNSEYTKYSNNENYDNVVIAIIGKNSANEDIWNVDDGDEARKKMNLPENYEDFCDWFDKLEKGSFNKAKSKIESIFDDLTIDILGSFDSDYINLISKKPKDN